MARVYSVGAKHEKEEVIFHLRGISVAEENRYTARFADISDLDSVELRAEKEYEILTDSLAIWSEKFPTIKVDGKELTVGEEGAPSFDTPEAAVRAYFAEKTNDKERTAQQVVIQYRRKLQPEVVFY